MFFLNLQVPPTYIPVDTLKKLSWLVNELSHVSEFAFDIETNYPTTNAKDRVPKDWDTKICGISYAWSVTSTNPWKPGMAAYVPLTKADDSPFWKSRQDAVLNIIKEIQELPVSKIAQNGKFDCAELARLNGIKTRNFVFDTMLAHSLIDEDRIVCSHALKSEGAKQGMADTYLDLSASQFKEDLSLALKHYDPVYMRYSKVPLDILYPYGCADSDFTIGLKNIFVPLLEAENLLWYFNNITMPLQHALMCMELQGVPLDIERAREVAKEQKEIMNQLEPIIYQIFGRKFDIGSTKQLGRILFEDLRIPGGVRNKTGWVVDSNVIKSLQHPIMDAVRQPLLDWRRASKIYSTYAVAALNSVREVTDGGKTGWVHCTYWMDSKTSRLKPTDPNMSTLPRPENGGIIVKSMFAPNENYRFVFKDYSQVELCVAAHLSGEPIWVEGFNKGYDMHAAMAHKVFNLDCAIEEVSTKYKAQRSKAKAVNFGILYGESPYALSGRIDMTPEKAQDFIENEYFGAAVTLKNWIDSVHQYAIENGYVTSFFGRRRHLPDAQLRVPRSMSWPDFTVRPSCYRDGPYLSEIQIDINDIYNLEPGVIRGSIRAHTGKKHTQCLDCPFVKSCIVNREVKYIKGRINAALRQAVNFPIQSTAVDIASTALVWLTKELVSSGLDAAPVNHGHDELAVLSHVSCVDQVCRIMDDCMVNRMMKHVNFSVPLSVDTEISERWKFAKRFVLYSPRYGVYLGSQGGQGFWSLVNPGTRDSATIFRSEKEALDIFPKETIIEEELMARKVFCSKNKATIEECAAVGLPRWEVERDE